MASKGSGKASRAPSKLAQVKLLALDVDGVLTDGSVVYVGDEELQRFSVYDGQAIRWLLAAGIEVAWISGRGSKATTARASELGVRELHLHSADKSAVLREIQERTGIPPARTLAMGDDLADLRLAARAAYFAAPANARAEVQARADLVTSARGGEGAVRELAERILRAQNRWRALVDSASG